MNPRPVNPYTSLVNDASQWARKTLNPLRSRAWVISDFKKAYSLTDVAEAVRTAKRLGYRTVLEVTDEGHLVCVNEKLPPSPPWQLLP